MRNIRVWAIVALTLLTIIVTFCVRPIAQAPSYHNFVDSRVFLGLSNFFDVVSSLPFIVLGIMGLDFTRKKRSKNSVFRMKGERFLWKTFFFAILLVGLGSGYYHLVTNNASMLWDRLPITIAFMALLSLITMERIGPKFGLMLSPIMIVMGIGTVFYWYYTESLGRGDLRPYILVQLLPLMLIPLMFWAAPARYTKARYVPCALVWYVIAKLLEYFDKTIFDLSGSKISGHTLKHIVVAIGIYMLLIYLQRRKYIK